MQTVVITPPESPLIQPATVRSQLGLTASVPDDRISTFVAAATAVLDGPEGWLGRSLGTQTLELQVDGFPRCFDDTIKLLCPPVQAVTSVKYVDSGGAVQTLDPAAYVLNGRRLTPAYGTSWPAARCQPNAVQIRYTAGYEAGALPAPIQQAIILSVSTMNAMLKADPMLSQDTVISVSSQSWTSADVGAMYDRAAKNLLATYRVID